jgi:hypothetical protein
MNFVPSFRITNNLTPFLKSVCIIENSSKIRRVENSSKIQIRRKFVGGLKGWGPQPHQARSFDAAFGRAGPLIVKNYDLPTLFNRAVVASDCSVFRPE